MNQLMLDIETGSTSPGGVIFEIGAVVFNTEDGITDKFECILNFNESRKMGFTLSPSTIDWWIKKGGVPEMYLQNDKIGNKHLLNKLTSWVIEQQVNRFWSNGSMDFVMLLSYYQRYSLNPFWKYWEVRELRTALDILGHDIRWDGVSHSAVSDAEEQTNRLLYAITKHE